MALLLLAVFVAFLGFNHHLSGPAYLSDEIGYLSKAAALAGAKLDMATDWHGGYSFFIAPAFALGSGPEGVWQAIQLINASLWCMVFVTLWYLLQALYPERPPSHRLIAVGLCTLYPSCLVSSGYALATVGFVLFFQLSLLALLHPGKKCLLAHSLCAGLCYWCHPSGLAVVGASLLIHLAAWRWTERTLSQVALGGITLVSLVAAYKTMVTPWWERLLSSQTFAKVDGGTHYPDTESTLTALMTGSFWHYFAVMLMGAVAYLLVASFGVALFGARESVEMVREHNNENVRLAMAFLLLSVLALCAVSAAFLAKLVVEFRAQGPHIWFQGRYVEGVLLPLIAIGLLGRWNGKGAVAAALQVSLAGMLLEFSSNPENTAPGLILLNVQGFWPLALFPEGSFLLWFGAAAVVILAVAGFGKRYSLLLVLPLVLATTRLQLQDHQRILSDYSRPTSIRQVVQALYPDGGIVGLDPKAAEEEELVRAERRNFYSFYLFDYGLQRMSFEQWRRHPEGPYLTFDREKASEAGLWTVARERKTGLFLVVPQEIARQLDNYQGPTQGIDVDWTGSGALVAGCFSLPAEELARFSQVGSLREGKLVSDGREGALFFGPYLRMVAGDYVLKLRGTFPRPNGAVLDVLSEGARQEHLRVELPASEGEGELRFPFSLSGDVEQLEVRLVVGSQSLLEVSSCAVELAP